MPSSPLIRDHSVELADSHAVHDIEEDPASVLKRYESMSFDEMAQRMAESYRQLSEVLGNRVSTPSTTSSSSDKTTTDTTFDAALPDDDDFDDERVIDRTDLDDAAKRQRMNKLLSRAASSGDLAKVNHLLKDERLRAYIDVDAKDEDGATPLIYAACFGKVEVAQALLEAGAKTDIQDSCKLQEHKNYLRTGYSNRILICSWMVSTHVGNDQ